MLKIRLKRLGAKKTLHTELLLSILQLKEKVDQFKN